MRELIHWMLAALLVLAGVNLAHAKKSVALIIGNSDYKHTSQLQEQHPRKVVELFGRS